MGPGSGLVLEALYYYLFYLRGECSFLKSSYRTSVYKQTLLLLLLVLLLLFCNNLYYYFVIMDF